MKNIDLKKFRPTTLAATLFLAACAQNKPELSKPPQFVMKITSDKKSICVNGYVIAQNVDENQIKCSPQKNGLTNYEMTGPLPNNATCSSDNKIIDFAGKPTGGTCFPVLAS